MVIVREKTAFPELAKIFAATPVAVWRDYLTLHYLHMPWRPICRRRFDDADFAFYGKVLAARASSCHRATRGVHLLDSRLGEALGKLYVAQYFPPESKAKAEALVANLLKAYDADIQTLTWMTDATSKRRWRSCTSSRRISAIPTSGATIPASMIKRDDLRRRRPARADVRMEPPAQPHRPAGRQDEWGMTPPTINAYYNPSFNEIVFPAAILQPPFFDPNADDAVNYGGIGAVIGHEISHGFDDQGSKYRRPRHPAELVDRRRPQGLRANAPPRSATQYDAYEPLPGLHVQRQRSPWARTSATLPASPSRSRPITSR